MYKHIPKVLKNINNKFFMVSKTTFLYKSDYINGYYDRIKNIFDIYGDLDQQDLNELEIFLAYFE
jgi:hypothetical protein